MRCPLCEEDGKTTEMSAFRPTVTVTGEDAERNTEEFEVARSYLCGKHGHLRFVAFLENTTTDGTWTQFQDGRKVREW